MYYVMSAECVDGGVEPFLHAVCEDEETAAEEVARVARALGIDVPRGTNDCDKWAETRYDEDGLLAWSHSDWDTMKTVVAKYVDTTRKDICT